jgi:hypothetical protein
MTLGDGRYAPHCRAVREETDADLVIVMVVNGNLGDGFDVQHANPEMLKTVPALLETLAAQIREAQK